MRRVVAVLVAVLLVGVCAVGRGSSAPVYGPQHTIVIAADISSVV